MSYIKNYFDVAKLEILETYGHNTRQGRKSLHKYGRATSLGTAETEINALNKNETYVSDNLISHVSSSSADDTHAVLYEGMTISGGELSFISDSVTLQGQTKVALPTPVVRSTRAQSPLSDLAGDVYFYEDDTVTGGVPDTTSKQHNLILIGDNTTLRAGTSTSSNNYLLINKIYAYINKQTNGTADIRLKIRSLGGAFVTVFVGGISKDSSLKHDFGPFLIVPPNSDIYLTAKCSTTNLEISAGFVGHFADIIE